MKRYDKRWDRNYNRSYMTRSRAKYRKCLSFDLITYNNKMISCNYDIFNNPMKVQSRINEMKTYK